MKARIPRAEALGAPGHVNASAAAATLARLHARFEAELTRPIEVMGSRADALIRGQIRYLQIRARRVCADAGIPEPDWANDPLRPGELGGSFRGPG